MTALDATSSVGRPSDHKLLSRTVADWLATRIIAGETAPGERLVETRLAELAGVSRSPVREALRILAGEGLVELVPRIGAQVARIGPDDVRELYACRLIIEPPCAAAAVAVLTPGALAELDMLRAAMERAVADEDERAFLAQNIAYFRALVARCPNGLLRDFVEQTWNRAIRYWSVLARTSHYGRTSLALHATLHAAVRAGDARAAETADRAILERALQQILTALEPQADAAA
jgi:DNA-binding GntR family transcriptional regulator